MIDCLSRPAFIAARVVTIASLLLCVLAWPPARTHAQAQARPGIDDVINLKRVGSPAISPNGKLAAYTVRETNWDENAY